MGAAVSSQDSNGLEIAIISMACRFPGAKNIDEFWQNLQNGVESITRFSDNELAVSDIDAGLLNDPNFVKARGILEDIQYFDAAFFGCSPHEAETMDPQYRLFLECAWETLEGAGYNPELYKGLIGIYAGSASNHYLFANIMPRYGLATLQEDAQVMMGNDREYLTSRISYKFNLQGPAVTVQSACSTSLVAVHQACQGLLNGECDMALAGGVSIGVPQNTGYLYQEGGIASPDGHCRAFDASAQGTVFSNGLGIVLLKRLADAVDDGDCIEAIIKGSAINNDGSSKVSFTAPGVDGQTRVIRAAQLMAEVDARSISYVETHGTATPLGDPIEIAALTQAFRASTNDCAFCAIGSVKTNIGHANTASGIAGLIKTVLALKHRQIPPSLHFEKANPQIDFARSPFYVNTQLTTWESQRHPRRAGVSSFGIGGTNAHVILEEAPQSEPLDHEETWQLLPLSAMTPFALEAVTANLLTYLRQDVDVQLADIAHTLQQGRKPFRHRQILQCRNIDDALHSLVTRDSRRLMLGVSEPQERFTVFMFPGQGTQYLYMAQELYTTEPLFREQVDLCGDILLPYLDMDLRALLYPSDESDLAARLDQTAMTQPALFVIEYALSQLWISWGVRPQAMIGHSIGEYVAACLAGVFSLKDALMLVAERGRLMQSMPPGAMLTVPLSIDDVQPFLHDGLSIASSNGPARCVVSGPEDEIATLEQHLATQGTICRCLRTSHAFHSTMMQPIIKPFVERVKRFSLHAPTIPYISNLSGTWITAEEATNPAYWGEHLLHAVLFYEGCQTLLKEGCNGLFLEVGPGQSLSLLLKLLAAKNTRALVFPSLRRFQDACSDKEFILKTAGQLWLAGVPLNWDGLHVQEHYLRVPLPTYPFERKRYWIDAPGRGDAVDGVSPTTSNAVKTTSIEVAAATQQTRTLVIEPQKEMVMLDSNRTTAPSMGRRERLIAILRGIFGQLLGIDSEEIDPQTTFLEMGADSLLLLQANQAIRQKFQVTVPFRLMLDEYPDIIELAACIDDKLPADALPPEPSVLPVTAAAQAEVLPDRQRQAPPVDTSAQTSESSGTVVSNDRLALPELPAALSTTTEMGHLLEQQLQLMSQQLEMFRRLSTPELPAPKEDGTSLTKSVPNRLAEAAAPLSQAAKISLLSVAPPVAAPPNVAMPVTFASPVEALSTPLHFSRHIQQETFVPYRPSQKTGKYGMSEKQLVYLKKFIERYNIRTRESKQLAQTYRPFLADNKGVTGFRLPLKELLYPLAVKHAQGARLWDVDGNEYVDTAMGYGSLLFGHSPAFITKTIEEQIQHGIQIGPQSPLIGKTAQLLCDVTKNERATFCTSGTEAVMTALRIARAATGRPKIAMFTGSFHGTFDGILVVPREGTDEDGAASPMAPGVPPHIVDDVLVLQFDTPASLEIIKSHAHELAAVLVEPRQSRRPDLQPVTFLRELRQVTQDAGIALIFDEVVTGFRTHLGGVQGLLDIKADITTYGKALGGGIPVSAIAGKAAFMNVIDGGAWMFGDGSYPEVTETFFAGTFFKHPLIVPVVWNILNHLKEHSPQIQEHLNDMTDQITNDLNRYFEQQEIPILVVNFGSLFRFVFPPELKTITADIFFYHLVEKGVYLSEGRNCFLSTAHTTKDIQFIVQAVQSSITEMRSGGFFTDPNLLPPTSEDDVAKSSHQRQKSSRKISGHEPMQKAHSASTLPSNNQGASIQPVQYVPLTDAQKALWILLQAGDDASRAYNESFSLVLQGQLDLNALRTAVRLLVERHEALRTTFSVEGDYQIIVPALHLDVPLIDLSHVDGVRQETLVSIWLKREISRPFDLEQGPLIRASVLKKSANEHLLVLLYHHIIVDGWSISVLLQELSELYSATYQQRHPQLPEPGKFSEYTQWLGYQQKSEVMYETERYWKEHFATIPPSVELPTDRQRPALKTFAGAQKRRILDKKLVARLKSFSAQQHCTLYVTLLSCFQTLLYRLCRQEDFVVGIPTAGQPMWGEKGNHLVGHCMSLLPLRSSLNSETTFVDHIYATKVELLDAYEHGIYPFIRLLQTLNLPRDLSRSPLFSTLFNFDRPASNSEGLTFTGLQCDGVMNPVDSSKYDLTLELIEVEGEIIADFTYSTDLFEAATVERWATHFCTLLESIMVDPTCSVSTLALLTETELAEICVERNATETAYPAHLCVHDLFEEQVARTPLAIAVEDSAKKLTYRELDERANQVAHYLQGNGVQAGDCIGICMQRSVEMLVSLLGIFKAGAAFLPLDPTFPQERITFMLNDAQAKIVFAQERTLSQLPAIGLHIIRPDSEWEIIAQESLTRPGSAATGDYLAYIMYTSGSTGKPKGVLIPHRGLVNYLVWCAEAYGAVHGRGAPVQSSIAADAIFPSLFAPLLVGTCVTMLPEAQSLESLNDALREQGGFSMIKITPTQLEVLNQQLPQEDVHGWVRTLVVGAEALRGDTLHFWQEHAPGTILLNEYGPTETVVGCSIYQIPEGQVTSGPVPIGLPIANTTFYVLDNQLQLVPIGVAGELYIGGDGVAWGYLNRAELTASIFIPDPFTTKPGARLYKTGDLVRYLPDKASNIEFLGRIDQQVKMRGYRVELGEVEAALAEHEEVEQVVVVVRECAPEINLLAAYVIAASGCEPQANGLRHFLQQKLPDYMVPSVFVFLASLPLTATGKVDTRALPSPERLHPELEKDFVAPRNETERLIAEIWSDVLRIDQIGIHDNFFELRGDSLLATQVVTRIRSSLYKTFTLRKFFEAPTVAGLAVHIEVEAHQERQDAAKFASLLEKVQHLSDTAIDDILSA